MGYLITNDWAEMDGTKPEHRERGPLTLVPDAKIGKALQEAFMLDRGQTKDEAGAIRRQAARLRAIFESDRELHAKLPWPPARVEVVDQQDLTAGVVHFAIRLYKTDPGAKGAN